MSVDKKNIPQPGKQFNPDKFIENFIQHCQSTYRININKDDPLIALITLLRMSCAELAREQENLLIYNADNMTKLSKAWQEREQEFIESFAKSLDVEKNEINELITKHFLEAVQNLYAKQKNDQLNKLEQLIDNKLQSYRKFSWLPVIVSSVILGIGTYLNLFI